MTSKTLTEKMLEMCPESRKQKQREKAQKAVDEEPSLDEIYDRAIAIFSGLSCWPDVTVPESAVAMHRLKDDFARVDYLAFQVVFLLLIIGTMGWPPMSPSEFAKRLDADDRFRHFLPRVLKTILTLEENEGGED